MKQKHKYIRNIILFIVLCLGLTFLGYWIGLSEGQLLMAVPIVVLIILHFVAGDYEREPTPKKQRNPNPLIRLHEQDDEEYTD